MKIINLIFVLMLSSLQVLANERVEWKQDEEILLQLIVEKERRIVFPEKVNFYEEPAQRALFHKSFIGSTFYITPLKSFSTRLVFQSSDSQRIYVVKAVSSHQEESSNLPNSLVIQLASGDEKSEMIADENHTPWKKESAITAVDLIQLASQSLYSDVVEPVDGIKRVAVEKKLINGFYRGGGLKVEPLAGWFGGGLYVTAIGLTNTTSEVIIFNPCRIRGNFLYASSQFSDLQPVGTDHNENVAYLVSDIPFSKASMSRVIKCLQK